MKKLFILLSFLLLFTTPKIEAMPPYNNLIRVGITNSNLSSLKHTSVIFSSTKEFKILEKNNKEAFLTIRPNNKTSIYSSNGKLYIYAQDGRLLKISKTPLTLESETDDNIFKIEDITRNGKVAMYRGEFEITQVDCNPQNFYIINIVDMEDYLKGVVPNELPVRFGLEALKAQTIAARNYSVRPIAKKYYDFDVCDTVDSQVYSGYNTEQKESNDAIENTKGLFSLYNGSITLALYSSTAGGYTEDYENAFPEGNPLKKQMTYPYLKGKPDFAHFGKLDTDEAATNFYTSSPNSFDENSRYFRWTRNWTKEELEKSIQENLPGYSGSGFVNPNISKNENIGTLKNIKVLKRGVSGKITLLEITTDKGTWLVKKELVIRKILKKDGGSLPSANLVFITKHDIDGNLSSIEANGGGFGHGVGMSQYGAGYMSKNGYTFNQILQHYYDGISIGTLPILLNNKIQTSITQSFTSPNGRGEILIENPHKLKNIEVSINSKDLAINTTEKLTHLDISDYLMSGTNKFVIKPLTNNELNKSAKIWIEVYKAKNEQE